MTGHIEIGPTFIQILFLLILHFFLFLNIIIQEP